MKRALLSCGCTIYATFARVGQPAHCDRHGGVKVVSVG